MQNLITPRAAFLADVPAGERTPREDMINIANSYFESIEHGDGEIAPFAEDCERHENGGTSNLQAGEIFKIRGGKIHEIEAMGVSLPYGTKSGWE